jgi:hypothetical protein
MNRSITATAFGIIFLTIGICFEDYTGYRNVAFQSSFRNVGWTMMITGSSLVLYSRLHLLLFNSKFLRIILLMILLNTIVFQLPDFSLVYFSNKIEPALYSKVKDILSKFDIIFTVQEVFLSSLYIFHFTRFLRQGGTSLSRDMMKTFYFLIIAEAVIITFNVTLNVLLYLHFFLARRMILGLFYAIQLRIEFVVLNRLVLLGRRRQADMGNNVRELVARNTTPDMSPNSVVSAGSKTPISPQLDTIDNGSESVQAASTVIHLNESRVQRADMEEEISVLTPLSRGRDTASNAEDESQNENDMEELERLYLGRIGALSAI